MDRHVCSLVAQLWEQNLETIYTSCGHASRNSSILHPLVSGKLVTTFMLTASAQGASRSTFLSRKCSLETVLASLETTLENRCWLSLMSQNTGLKKA